MKKEIVENISLCKKLWYQFSPNTSIWDLWKTIFSFYDPKSFQPYFIFLENKGRKGLLPLWLSKKSGRYFFFGGDFPENRAFWFPPEMFPEFFRVMPRRTVLYDINKSSAENVIRLYPQFQPYFCGDEQRYFLDLAGINYDLDKYFKRFSSKHRRSLFHDINKLRSRAIRLEWLKGVHNLKRLIEFNKKRFEENSDFLDPKWIHQFTSFLRHIKDAGMTTTLSAKFNGEIVGVELAAIWGEVFYVLSAGFDPEYVNLGKLLTFEQIEKARIEHCREIDFLVGDTGWKELWNLDKEPVFTLDKEDMSDDSLSLLANL